MTRFRIVLATLLAATLAYAPSALGCAVCFGDPDSDLAKGAVRGVLFLAAVIGGLLLSIAGIAVGWSMKARRLNLENPENLRS
jgi:hypothetical protein